MQEAEFLVDVCPFGHGIGSDTLSRATPLGGGDWWGPPKMTLGVSLGAPFGVAGGLENIGGISVGGIMILSEGFLTLTCHKFNQNIADMHQILFL